MVVCTATASGKSLCYNLPILEALAQDRKATALYMFPTKALAQDQLRALRELCDWTFGEDAPFVDIYDGDTPKARRQASKRCSHHPTSVTIAAWSNTYSYFAQLAGTAGRPLLDQMKQSLC